ncbi:MAG: hypothetical protein LQ346_000064 [Caloplaca aetnensis]|nr:MAG: hypothetical protein LQ346_000064 [Caloplaca aetnensis]
MKPTLRGDLTPRSIMILVRDVTTILFVRKGLAGLNPQQTSRWRTEDVIWGKPAMPYALSHLSHPSFQHSHDSASSTQKSSYSSLSREQLAAWQQMHHRHEQIAAGQKPSHSEPQGYKCETAGTRQDTRNFNRDADAARK